MSSFAIESRVSQKRFPSRGLSLLAGYVAVYACSLFCMAHFGGFEPEEAIGVFAILGVAFSALAWVLTLGIKPLPYAVKEPSQELALLLLYMLPLAAFVAYGFSAIHRWVVTEPADSIAILVAKLAVFVAIPAALLGARFHYRSSEWAPSSVQTSHVLVFMGMSVAILVFQSVAGRGMRDIVAAHVPLERLLFGMPLVFLWLALEVGVVEEFFFRVLLQTRLTAVLRSELGGIVLMSLLFGLVHAPSLWMAIGYSIVITSAAGFFFGVLWARTRNFLLLVAVHAAADLLPNTLPTLRAFHFLQ